MKIKSDQELVKILERYELYDRKAVLAAIEELQNRKIHYNGIDSVKTKLEKSEKINEQVNIDDSKNEHLFSKPVIFFVSFLLHPLIGSILLSANFFDAKKNRWAGWVLCYGVTYTLLSLMILNHFSFPFWLVILLNGFGCIILLDFFWKKYFR